MTSKCCFRTSWFAKYLPGWTSKFEKNIRNTAAFLQRSSILKFYYDSNPSLVSWFSSRQVRFGVIRPDRQVEWNSYVIHWDHKADSNPSPQSAAETVTTLQRSNNSKCAKYCKRCCGTSAWWWNMASICTTRHASPLLCHLGQRANRIPGCDCYTRDYSWPAKPWLVPLHDL